MDNVVNHDESCLTCTRYSKCILPEPIKGCNYKNCGIIFSSRRMNVGTKDGKVVSWMES